MFVYFYHSKTGYQYIQAFNKIDKAAEYVAQQLETYVSGAFKKPPKKKIRQPVAIAAQHFFDIEAIAEPQPPPIAIDNWQILNDGNAQAQPEKPKKEEHGSKELIELQSKISELKKNKNYENVMAAIHSFEEYSKYVIGEESAIHTLQDIKMVE